MKTEMECLAARSTIDKPHSLRVLVHLSNALKNQHGKIKNRLSKLYDSKFDGEISEEIFRGKEMEYKNQLTELESQMDGIQVIDRDFYEFGYKTFELSNKLCSHFMLD